MIDILFIIPNSSKKLYQGLANNIKELSKIELKRKILE